MLPRWRFAAAGRYRAHDDEGPEDRRFRLYRQFSVSNSGKIRNQVRMFLVQLSASEIRKAERPSWFKNGQNVVTALCFETNRPKLCPKQFVTFLYSRSQIEFFQELKALTKKIASS